MLHFYALNVYHLLRRALTCMAGAVVARHAGVVMAAMLSIATPLTAEFEGLRLKAYLDAVGIPSICYGETEGVKLGDVKSKPECDRMLALKVAYHGQRVAWAVGRDIPTEMHAALTSWSYNVGDGAMARSSLIKLARAGDFRAACNQLPRWVYAKGVVLPGLVVRREKERQLCLSKL